MKIFLLFLLTIFLEFTSFAVSQTRQNLEGLPGSRKDRQLTICSQNLKNYGEQRFDPKKILPYTPKENALMQRFILTGCDVIAVQEVIGIDEIDAKGSIDRLARFLKFHTGREFKTYLGDVNENLQRVGFLVATDRADVQDEITYRKVTLPKLDENQKPRLFTRAPLELQLSVKSRGDAPEKKIALINFHFKSKTNSKEDPALLQWETYRMEMAEGVRRVALQRYKSLMSQGQVVILLGDRNSDYTSASANILKGGLMINDFRGKGVCRLTKTGTPICQAGVQKQLDFDSVITSDPETSKLKGTFIFKKEVSFLDDILANTEALGLFRSNPDIEGNYDSGIVSEFKDASDHAMVYVRMRW